MDALDFVTAICSSLNQSDQPTQAATFPTEYHASRLITHLVYFEDGHVKVDRSKLEDMGIRCVPAKSRLRSKNGAPKFDEESVRQALLQITRGAS